MSQIPKISNVRLVGGAVTLRPESAGDEAFLLEVYAGTRQEELDATGWDAAAHAAFIELQFRAMRHGYRSMFPQGEFSIILLQGQPVGRAVVHRDGRRIHLVDLAVLPRFRNRGIGTALLRQWIEEAKQADGCVQLEVQKGGRSHRLYERLRFRKFAETELFESWEWTGDA